MATQSNPISFATQSMCREVTAAILAGGLGTRLRPTLGNVPKVLAPVGRRPFVTILLDQLTAAGVTKTVLLLGHRAEEVRRAVSATHRTMALTFSVEDSPLGTGGALRQALSEIDTETVLLLNGDSFCDVNLPRLVSYHRAREADLTLTLAHASDASRFGSVCLTEAGQVTAFREKLTGTGPAWINAGVYALRTSLVDTIPPGQACSLERDLLPHWLVTHSVWGYTDAGRFLDIGTPSSYSQAEAFFAI